MTLSVEMKKLDLDPTLPASALYQQWNIAVTKVMDKHMPIRKMRVREKDAPYMTIAWKKAIRKKRKYAKLHKKHPTQENEQLMKKWRSTATRLRRSAIKSYWRERSAELKN